MKKDLFGTMIISLDFELIWGFQEKKDVDSFKNRLSHTREVIPRILELFEKYDVSATWATVGMLFHESKQDWLASRQDISPQIDDIDGLNGNIKNISLTEVDQFCFANDLIEQIKGTAKQEVSTHTYSHYYCLDEGNNKNNFKKDLDSAIKVSKKYDVIPESIVFPRNQVNKEYIPLLLSNEITSYRGVEPGNVYKSVSSNKRALFRVIRLIDSYINILGHNTYSWEEIDKQKPINLMASRFFRPASKYALLDKLKIRRIKSDLLHAAMERKIYHLWWHPHNFGVRSELCLEQLEEILSYYSELNQQYGLTSQSMNGAVSLVN